MIPWIPLTSIEQIEDIKTASHTISQILFKHSTRCSISSMVKDRLERSQTIDNITFYYLDLIAYRDISNKIAEVFNIPHESPQILVIKNEECIYDESHMAIEMNEIKEHI